MKYKRGDVCMIVQDKLPFHHLAIGTLVLIDYVYIFSSIPYWSRYCEKGRNKTYEDFKECELLKIGELG